MDKGTREIDESPRLGLQPGPSPRAILVLGTPVGRDIIGRMELAIALLANKRGEVIVALGTSRECKQMSAVANKNRLATYKLILDENSKTTIDNAYFAKKICKRLDLTPSILVTSHYQNSRAVMTFRRVFGPGFCISPCPSPSLTSTRRRLREALLRTSVPLLHLFRNGDDEELKRASDFVWKLLGRR